jgi:hypothetical protein
VDIFVTSFYRTLKITGMDEQNHKKLLQLQSAELTERTPFCPEDQLIAEYFDGGLPHTEFARLERHLSDCRFCLARLGVLERLDQNPGNIRISGNVLASAKQMTRKAPARRVRGAQAWATAAVVVLALFTIVNNGRDSEPEPGAIPIPVLATEANNRQLRTAGRMASSLNVLHPEPGAGIAAGSLIEWAEVPGNIHYDIFVLSHTGDVLLTERLEGTDWVLDETLHLTAGSKYYFRVEAQLPDGSSVSSQHVNFKVTER